MKKTAKPFAWRSIATPETDRTAPRLIEGLKKIVQSEMAMMPAPDFSNYTFIFHFAPDIKMGDGMEHLNSTEIIVRGSLSGGALPRALEIAAHEFFHLWNVKRLRPAGLGPFDYSKEVYTKSLVVRRGHHNLLRLRQPAPLGRMDARRTS